MNFKENFNVESDRQNLWDFLMDVHKVASCMGGVEELSVIDTDRYRGVMLVRMGPVKLRFKGDVDVTSRDRENWTATVSASANDAKAGGGFKGSLQMELSKVSNSTTALVLDLETTLLGKIGELGRPLIKRKVSSMMRDFSEALTLAVNETPGSQT